LVGNFDASFADLRFSAGTEGRLLAIVEEKPGGSRGFDSFMDHSVVRERVSFWNPGVDGFWGLGSFDGGRSLIA
jgi:hypothetical protein